MSSLFRAPYVARELLLALALVRLPSTLCLVSARVCVCMCALKGTILVCAGTAEAATASIRRRRSAENVVFLPWLSCGVYHEAS